VCFIKFIINILQNQLITWEINHKNQTVMKIKKEYLYLAGIVLFGVAARIIKFDSPDLVMDTVAYSRLGKNLIEFGRYSFGENYNTGIFFPPGYAVLIGIVSLFSKDLFFSAKLVSFILSCGSIVLSYLIGKDLYNKEAGLFAALLYAIYPILIIISVQGYSDAPFIFFLLLSLFLFIRFVKKDNIVLHAFLGFIFGVTGLIRPEALFLLLLPGIRVFGAFDPALRFKGRYALHFIVVSLVFVLTLSPYLFFVKNYTGKFSLSGKSNISILLGELSTGDLNYHQIVNAPDNVYDKAAFSLTESKTQLRGWSKDINPSLLKYIFKDPFNFAKKYQKNLFQEIQILIKLLTPFILPLFFSFFYRDLFTNRSRMIFLLLPLVFFLMYPIFIIIEKQTMLVVVFLLLFSSGGFTNSQKVISDLGSYYGVEKAKIVQLLEQYIKYVMVAILITGSLVYLKYSTFENFDRAHAKPEEHKRAGYFLKEKLSPKYESLNIMSKEPYVSFYSGSRYTMMPYANITDVINFAKLYGVDYIVVDERALSGWDHYNELLQMDKYSSDVELYYEDKSEKLIKLFKVRK
jgi:4-amino-4-deoxy-L-arabinose transferase-like glycosyltransferase